jgi:hypothetical protein
VFIDCTSVFEWLDSLIGPGELLLVVSDLFAIRSKPWQALLNHSTQQRGKGGREREKTQVRARIATNQSGICSPSLSLMVGLRISNCNTWM